MEPVTLLGCLLIIAAGLISAAFVVETSLGLQSHGEPSILRRVNASAVVLVPAHNEASLIQQSVLRLREQLPQRTRILVVADNCSDETAVLARGADVEVIERQDLNRRGKGYALAFGRAHLKAGPPDVVIVLDADCQIERTSLEQLIYASSVQQKPVQARYLLHAAPGAAPITQISNFAFMVKNDIRQRGARRIGAAAVLTGTGMAFPWRIFDQAHFSGGSVEDLDLTVELVASGIHPFFASGATVLSLAASTSATKMQRDRWERGFVATAAKSVPRLLGASLRRRSWAAFWLAVHLLTPPLALLVLFYGGTIVVLAAMYLFADMSPWPLMVQCAAAALLCILIISAWVQRGRAYLAPATMLKIPAYVFWKLPIYLRLLKGTERTWNRTER